MAKALLLDRDGVINEDHGYVCKVEDFHFIDGIFDLCRTARDNDFVLILVVNQAGIGRGYYDEAQFHRLTDWMKQQFDARGVPIEAVYFCPYHPTAGVGRYRRVSSWRKPAPGMLLQAAKDHDLDLASSAMIGNAPTDMEAAAAAGVGLKLLYVLVRGCLINIDPPYAVALPDPRLVMPERLPGDSIVNLGELATKIVATRTKYGASHVRGSVRRKVFGVNRDGPSLLLKEPRCSQSHRTTSNHGTLPRSY